MKVAVILIAAAQAAQKAPIAPTAFSGRRCGDGRGWLRYSGCNVENASYGLSLCGEKRRPEAAAGTALKVVAIVARLAKPCGACRQVMAEFSDKNTRLYLLSRAPALAAQDHRIKTSPEAFGPKDL